MNLAREDKSEITEEMLLYRGVTVETDLLRQGNACKQLQTNSN